MGFVGISIIFFIFAKKLNEKFQNFKKTHQIIYQKKIVWAWRVLISIFFFMGSIKLYQRYIDQENNENDKVKINIFFFYINKT